MTGKSIKLFRVIGIQVSLDHSWFIVFALVAWSLAQGYFPYLRPHLRVTSYWFMGLVSSLLLFLSVLFHELCHSYIANRHGVDIKEITLFIFGGVAQLTREPDKPDVEFKIAIAGPLSSFFLAGVFWVSTRIIEGLSPSSLFIDIFGYTMLINMVLAIFNLIPGFPLDGGRVLRAIWWWKTNSIQRATHVATNAGKAFSTILIIFGIYQIINLNFVGGMWAILIGMFLRQAAESSYQQVLIKKALLGVRVDDIMTRNLVTIDGDLTLSRALEEYFFHHPYVSYPVVSDGKVIGLIALENIRGIPKEEWETKRVSEVAKGIDELSTLNPSDTAIGALERMITHDTGRLLVLDKGSLAGMVTRRDIMKLLEARKSLEGVA